MSDGTNVIRYLDQPPLWRASGDGGTSGGLLVTHLNELEWIKGEIWANIWQTPQIARIDPPDRERHVVGRHRRPRTEHIRRTPLTSPTALHMTRRRTGFS